jgi:hypothetical protein
LTTTINASTTAGLVQTADTSGILQLQTASTAALTIDASQNVGIGGTPKSTGVSGALEFGPSTIGLVTSQFDGPYFTSNLYYSSGWKYASTGYASMYAQYQSQHKWYTATSGSANGAVTLTQAMTLDSSGNLLVGTTSQFNSGFFCVAANLNSLNGIAIKNTVTQGGSQYFVLFVNSAGNTAGGITHTGTTTVAYVTSSDYRMKENVTPMTGALDKVAQLKPVTYKWKQDGSNGEGFIAHELAEVCPYAVVGEKDKVDADGNPEYQGIDTSFLVATLTAALQETKALIDTQAELISGQAATINALVTRIEALENK